MAKSKGKVLKLVDCDDGATSMDVVKVPEGWSLQVGPNVEGAEFESIVIDKDQMHELQAHFLATEGME